MRSREGDLVQTRFKSIFDVKGLVHPPDRVVAFPRFIPDSKGSRRRKAISYKKVYALSERYRLLEESSPQYLVDDPVFGERLCEVPKRDIESYYSPITHLRELRESKHLDVLETAALRFVECLRSHSYVAWSKLGISGSLLVQLHTPKSDIDPIVYGEKNCLKIRETLESLTKNGKSLVRAFSKEELKSLYNFRSQDTEMSFDDFVNVEHRKVLQGMALQHIFYIRCIKDWDETAEHYGDLIYRKVGFSRIKAVIVDDSEAIFTPCRYSVENVRLLGGKGGEAVTEVASFRGRFCEQARTGETIVAQGKVEKMQRKDGETFFRLLLGGQPSDFMALER
jgi:predicted nucleotidyltransferase